MDNLAAKGTQDDGKGYTRRRQRVHTTTAKGTHDDDKENKNTTHNVLDTTMGKQHVYLTTCFFKLLL